MEELSIGESPLNESSIEVDVREAVEQPEPIDNRPDNVQNTSSLDVDHDETQNMTNSTDLENVQNPINSENGKEEERTEEYIYQYPPLFTGKTLLELCSSSWSRPKDAKHDIQPYLRGCKWSPEGTCCLSIVNNDGMHVTELPRDLYCGMPTAGRTIDILDSVIHIKEFGLIYDFCWYPGMNSTIPESCCWITTKKNGPVQMWDAFNGSLRASYRGFNAVDEMEPAYSVTYSSDGTRIIAGYKRCLRTFDVERPGRDSAVYNIANTAACLATYGNMLAVGSWNTTISLYRVNDMGGYKSLGKMHGHAGGVTHMKFTPDGLRLVSGARRDHRLLVWDIRYCRKPLNILHRAVDTSQKVYFDLSPCGKYLVTGATDGIVKVWDVDKVNWMDKLEVSDDGCNDATYKYPLHNDCCNSVSIHPLRPILATGSGQYHLKDPLIGLDEENEDKKEENSDVNMETMEADTETIDNGNSMKYSTKYENNVVVWWIGDVLSS